MKINKIKVFSVIIAIIIIVIVVFQITSNNKKKQSNETTDVKQVVFQDNLRLGISNVDFTNPLRTKNKQLMDIYQLVYEPLLTLDSQYKLNLCLATEYAKTSSTTYIMKIDSSIKWSNGSNLNADDIIFTVNLLKSTDNIYSENVKNIESVEAIDNSTVKFNLNKEVDFFEYNLIFPIMCKSYYGDSDFFSSEKTAIGTGMYKVKSISTNQIVLEKNENYRNQDKTNKNIKDIYINIFNEVGEVYNSFKIGNIDVMTTYSSLYKDYIGTIGYYVKDFKGREYDFLSLNCNDYLMKDKTVRQAINYAIDKENIVSTVFNNEYYVSDYMLDYGSFAYSNTSSKYNPEKAKELLSSDGWNYSNNRWRKNGGILTFTISVNSSNVKRCEVAKNIKNQLESIGIPVNIREMSDAQYKYCLEHRNYQVLLTGIYNSYSPDLTYFYGDNNIGNYKNDDVKSLMKDVKNTTEQRSLEEKFKTLVNITKDDCVYISLYRNKGFLLINQNMVGNFNPQFFGVFNNFETWNRE